MLIAVAFACVAASRRRSLVMYAVANAVIYCGVAVAGVVIPSAALLSFEVLMLFALPGIVLVIVVAARAKTPSARSILIAALLLVAVNMAYFAYYAAGVTQALWDGGDGLLLSENDVLHVGMIAWLIYVAVALGPTLTDWQSGARNQP